jgi:hypothetical protein
MIRWNKTVYNWFLIITLQIILEIWVLQICLRLNLEISILKILVISLQLVCILQNRHRSNKAISLLEIGCSLAWLLSIVALHKLCCVLKTALEFIEKLIVVLDKKIWRIWFHLKILSLRVAQVVLCAYWRELHMSGWCCRRV